MPFCVKISIMYPTTLLHSINGGYWSSRGRINRSAAGSIERRYRTRAKVPVRIVRKGLFFRKATRSSRRTNIPGGKRKAVKSFETTTIMRMFPHRLET
jgi:hypothetical protein